MKKIKVMFHGDRVDVFRKPYQLFKDKAGAEHRYSGIRGVAFGRVYATEDGKMKIHPEALTPAPWEPTDKEWAEYEAQKIVVSEWRQSRRKDMALHKPNPKIVQAVELLRPFYLSMTDLDRRRFMGWVGNECSKKKGRK